MEEGGTENAVAALVKLPVSATLQKYLRASSWSIRALTPLNCCLFDKRTSDFSLYITVLTTLILKYQ
jgi:hypothetical protein